MNKNIAYYNDIYNFENCIVNDLFKKDFKFVIDYFDIKNSNIREILVILEEISYLQINTNNILKYKNYIFVDIRHHLFSIFDKNYIEKIWVEDGTKRHYRFKCSEEQLFYFCLKYNIKDFYWNGVDKINFKEKIYEYKNNKL